MRAPDGAARRGLPGAGRLPVPSLDLQLYDELEQATHDLGTWLELARRQGGPVLELGSGTGRVAAALARAGHRVVALERDLAALDALVRRCRGPGEVMPVAGDARGLPLQGRFALILAPARLLEHLATAAEQAAVLETAARHLAADGLLALHLSAPPRADQPPHVLLPFPGRSRGAWWWRERLDRARQLRVVTVERHGLTGPAFGPLRLRWITDRQLETMARGAGLAIQAASVSTAGPAGGPERLVVAGRHERGSVRRFPS